MSAKLPESPKQPVTFDQMTSNVSALLTQAKNLLNIDATESMLSLVSTFDTNQVLKFRLSGPMCKADNAEAIYKWSDMLLIADGIQEDLGFCDVGLPEPSPMLIPDLESAMRRILRCIRVRLCALIDHHKSAAKIRKRLRELTTTSSSSSPVQNKKVCTAPIPQDEPAKKVAANAVINLEEANLVEPKSARQPAAISRPYNPAAILHVNDFRPKAKAGSAPRKSQVIVDGNMRINVKGVGVNYGNSVNFF